MADDIGLEYITVKAVRGNIYSDNGSLLATSLPEYRIAFDPSVSDQRVFSAGIDSLSLLLSKFFKDRRPADYKRKIVDARLSGRQYMILNRKQINYQEKKKIMQWPVFRQGRLRGGVIFERVDKRFRPFRFLGARTIGYINENNYGAGLEYSFNKVLAGTDGKALFQKMAGGNWKPVYDGTEIRPRDGNDIMTSIDINIQDVAETALLRALKAHQADYGCLVLMEVKTGEIKAISNLSLNKNGYYAENYNYAVGDQGLTEPGSTFKLASMIALFEDSNLQLTDSIETGDGRFKFYDRIMSDHKWGGYGKISIRDAFEKSSNIAVSKLVNAHFGLEPNRFINYLKEFGLNQPLGFQMIGEGIPYIKEPKDPTWSGTTLPWMSIGYELKLTPLQILAFYNAIANDGKFIQPVIVTKSRKADKVINEYNPAVINRKICSDETLQKIRSMLEGVVERGTAQNIKNAHYPIAGKTGTAQKIKDGGGYTKNYYTSFVGYFPADQPKYSCIVVIDNPKQNYQYGSDVAAPVFREVADKIYAKDLEIHHPSELTPALQAGTFPVIQSGNRFEISKICDYLGIENKGADNESWAKASINGSAIQWKTNDMKIGEIPDVEGMTLRDALFLLENQGLDVLTQGRGRVISQSIAPGEKVKKGGQIKIKLG